MSSLLAGISIRPPDREEIKQVFDFMLTCDVADYGEPDSDFEDLESQWADAGLEHNARIALDGNDQLVGYTFITSAGERFFLDAYIHRERSPEGLEMEILAYCENRAHELLTAGDQSIGSAALVGYAGSVNLRLRNAFESRGFRLHSHHYRMQIDFSASLPIPEWPAGFSVSSFQPQDEQELYELIYRVFDWPGRDPTPPPIEQWRRQLFRLGRFDPDLFLILRQSEKMVGAALAYDETTNGWIRQLAVAKELQGQGHGARLLRHILGIFSQRGLPFAALGVEAENEHAVQFYERCGMRQTRDFLEYRKKM